MGIKAKILKELQKKPRRLKELKAKLGNDKKVARAVDELVERNKVVCRKGVYAVPDPKTGNAVECTLVKLAGKFGFARPVQPDGQDIFIPGKYLMGAMPGDTLLVSLFEHPRVEGSSEGEVLAVVKENNRFTGTVETIEGRLALVPDACPHCPIYIKKSADGGARDGEKAAVEILERGDSHEDHRAGVAMRFGSAEEAKQCAKALLYGAGLSRHFPLKAKAEAKKYEGAAVGEKEAAGRRDYRGMPVFTIDSAETKDIDDAISLEKTDTGYRLGVHIADVSHYVRPGSALDAEAFARGTSVYYADSVIPMLPRQLSNGICSLNEGADRLAFSCMMELDAAGRVVDYAFVKSVIRSRVKGVYKEVNAIFDGTADNALRQRYAAVAQELPLMRELYHKLAKLRAARGAMDIESGEAKLVLDEAGRCVDVVKRERGEAEQMIEEFMLLANSSAAALARRLKLPFVYRVHEAPDPERIEKAEADADGGGCGLPFCGRYAHHAGVCEAVGRYPGHQSGAPGAHKCAAQHGQGKVRAAAQGPLRPCAGRLRPLHLAHPALSGPCHPPYPFRRLRGYGRRRGAEKICAVRGRSIGAVLRARGAGHDGGARCGGLLQGRIHAPLRGRGIRRRDLVDHAVRPVCGAAQYRRRPCARAGAFGKRAYAHRGRGAAEYSVRPGMAAGRRHARACGGRGCLSGQCGFRSGTGTVAEGAGASGPAGPGGRAADSRTRRGFCAPGKSAAAAAAPRAHPGVIPGALSAYAVAR